MSAPDEVAQPGVLKALPGSGDVVLILRVTRDDGTETDLELTEKVAINLTAALLAALQRYGEGKGS